MEVKMKSSKYLLILVLLGLIGLASAQDVDSAWVRRYHGTGNREDGANAIAVDGSGNVYVTGYSRGLGTDDDYVTIKYNTAGVQQWLQRYDGPGNSSDEAFAIAVDGQGNVYVTGVSWGSGTSADYATIKYNAATGETVWVRRYNVGTAADWARAIAVDGDGNVYVTGESWSGSSGRADYVTIKYDFLGGERWVQRYNGPQNGDDVPSAIAVDGSGNVYVTGGTGGLGTNYDCVTIKYNAATGDTAWVAIYDGPYGPIPEYDNDCGQAIALDGDGNVYVTGYSQGGPTIFDKDYLTIKYLPNGDTAWIRRYNGPATSYSYDYAYDIALDGSGNIYVTGQSRGSGTDDDYATIKYLPNGDTAWVRRYNGPANSTDEASAIALDGARNVYVTGSSIGSGTSSDYLTIKYDSLGVEKWVARYNGPRGDGFDGATAIAVDGDTNVYVTGGSYGLEGIGPYYYDYLTIKYVQPKGPIIGYSPLPDTTPTMYRTLKAYIKGRVSGVTIEGGKKPTLFYNKNRGTWYQDSVTTSTADTFTFFFNYSLFVGVCDGDTIFYYVQAYDSAGNMSINPINAPTTLNSYQILLRLSGDYYIGSGQTYPTLKSFFDAINLGHLISAITGNITSDITEEATATLNPVHYDAGGPYTITIRPSGDARDAHVVSGNIDGALVDLNGADRVIFDGDIHGERILTFRNENTGTLASTFTLRADACNNIIRNCIIEGASRVTSGTVATGTIVFGPGTTTGNDSNTISNNLIRERTSPSTELPLVAIFLNGLVAPKQNDNNTISGNEICNYGTGTRDGGGILASTSAEVGRKWVITSNHFYRTSSVFHNATHTVIRLVNQSGELSEGHIVSGNYIGGSAPFCAGTPYIYAASFEFYGIRLYLDTFPPGTIVENNTIQNIELTSTTSTYAVTMIGVYGLGHAKIAGNTIGHASTPGSITHAGKGALYGISYTAVCWKTVVIENNLIANIVSTNTGTTNGVKLINFTYGCACIRNNTIRDISTTTNYTTSNLSIVGIYHSASGTGHVIHGNTIQNLISSPSTATTNTGVQGIRNWCFDAAGIISSNLIHTLVNNSTGTGANIHGICINEPSGSRWTVANNMISLGDGLDNDVNIQGIRAGSVQRRCHYYYNSVMIMGRVETGANKTYAFMRLGKFADTLRNNIFANFRTGGTGGHFAIGTVYGDSWGTGMSDYNDLYAVTPTTVGEWVGTAYNFANWLGYSMGDSNSISLNPGFVSATDLHISPDSVNVDRKGTPIAEIATDIDGESRNDTFPDIGADEFGHFYTITATAYGPGSIVPSGSVIVYTREDTTFTFSPDIGAHFDSLIVDGFNHGAESTYYTFENVTTDHTIDAYFSINTYIILATTTSGGTITPSDTVIIEYGADTTFEISANTDYVLDSVLVDGISVGAVTSYPFTDVTDDHTIHAMFTMTALPGWAQKESILTPPEGKFIKDGGALVGVPGSDKDASKLYAFLGTKTNKVRIYTVGTGWSDGDSMIFGHKYNTTTHIIDTVKFAKKYPGKGAALCFDNDHTIYATKGNGTCEFFAYDLTTDAGWTAKAYVPTLKGLKGGTSIRWFNGKVYLLAGGQKKDPTVDNFFVYTPEGDSDLGTPWTALGKLPLGPDTKNWKDGSSIVELGGTIYAIHGGAKTNLFYAYDWGTNEWLTKEEIPIDDSSYHKYKKKLLVKDGAASASGNGVIYATKGGGTEVFWKYTPLSDVGWERLERMPIEKADKKHAPKTGAAMSYVDGKVWLLVGNKQVDFWCYVPTAAKSEKRIANSVNNVIASSTQSNVAISNFSITPNPFTNFTTIRYTVPVSGKVSLKLYNTSGRLIETFLDDYRNSGSYSLEIRNSNLEIPQGIYFLKYEDRTNTSEIKLIVQ
jgi:hypothetical protein